MDGMKARAREASVRIGAGLLALLAFAPRIAAGGDDCHFVQLNATHYACRSQEQRMAELTSRDLG